MSFMSDGVNKLWILRTIDTLYGDAGISIYGCSSNMDAAVCVLKKEANGDGPKLRRFLKELIVEVEAVAKNWEITEL